MANAKISVKKDCEFVSIAVRILRNSWRILFEHKKLYKNEKIFIKMCKQQVLTEAGKKVFLLVAGNQNSRIIKKN